jgi:threonine synthase
VEAVTLGEGGTPLLAATRLEPAGTLLLKNEAANPTLSFKDRGVSVAATMARERGALGFVAASTGNTAVSVAAYGAKAGMPVACLVPEGTPAGKLRMVTAAGARLLRVAGTYSDAHALARAIADRSGWANLTTTYVNPDMLEGNKTVGLEIFDQLGDRAPDTVVVPVGAGPLLSGIAMAFDDLVSEGRIDGPPPRLVAVQAQGCAPIARAFAEGAAVRPWNDRPVQTAAGSIADPLDGYAQDGDRTLAAVRATGGAAIAVDDDAIARARNDLAREEGLVVELGAAAALAGYRRLIEDGLLGVGDRTVLVLTGHGSKEGVAAGAAPPGAVAGTGTTAAPGRPGAAAPPPGAEVGAGTPGEPGRSGDSPAGADLGVVAPGAVDDALRALEAVI